MSEPLCPNGCGPLTSEPDVGLVALGCNECHYVEGAITAAELATLDQCGHGKPPDEWCETCDGNDEVDDAPEECTCPRARADVADERGFPCDACGRMVR